MLLNTEELLALADGDVEPDRLAVLLDRLENCPDSAAHLRVLVLLKAHREEALEALRIAADADPAAESNDIHEVPVPHPVVRPAPFAGWAAQGLRLAASIAVVGILGIWAVNSFLVDGSPPAHTLATQDFFGKIWPGPQVGELTADGSNVLSRVIQDLRNGRYEEVRDSLADEPMDASGFVPLFLGMSQYHLGEYEAAAATLAPIQDIPSVVDDGVKLQALWYEANALLALDRPWAALPLVERIATSPLDLPDLIELATGTYDDLCALLGINAASKQ